MIDVSDLPIWFFINWLLLIVININNICETHLIFIFSSYFSWWVVQFSSVAQSCPTLCDPMNCSTPGLPVHHQLPEFTQTHVHWLSQWCHPTISSSVNPFSSCPQSFLASGSFQMSQLFASGYIVKCFCFLKNQQQNFDQLAS